MASLEVAEYELLGIVLKMNIIKGLASQTAKYQRKAISHNARMVGGPSQLAGPTPKRCSGFDDKSKLHFRAGFLCLTSLVCMQCRGRASAE